MNTYCPGSSVNQTFGSYSKLLNCVFENELFLQFFFVTAAAQAIKSLFQTIEFEVQVYTYALRKKHWKHW